MDEFVSHIVKVVIIDTVICQLLCVQESCKIAKGSHRELSAQRLSCWFVFHPSIRAQPKKVAIILGFSDEE